MNMKVKEKTKIKKEKVRKKMARESLKKLTRVLITGFFHSYSMLFFIYFCLFWINKQQQLEFKSERESGIREKFVFLKEIKCCKN